MADGGSPHDIDTSGSVIGNPGEVRLVFDRVDAVFNNRIVAPAVANLGFVWSMAGEAACGDRVNNDDLSVLGRGLQDTLIDFPADPECASPDDASEDKAGLQERRPVVLRGEVDGEGRFIVPADGIDIPTVWAWSDAELFGGDRVHMYDFEPVGSAVGVLNPFTRDVGLHLRLRIRVRVEGSGSFTGPGEQCYVGSLSQPIAIRLTTIEAKSPAGLPTVTGAAYDENTGAIELVGYNVSETAAATDCGAFGSLNELVSSAFGVPAAAGNIGLVAKGRIEPAPVAAAGATPTMVRLPSELFPAVHTEERPARKSDGIVIEPQPQREPAQEQKWEPAPEPEPKFVPPPMVREMPRTSPREEPAPVQEPTQEPTQETVQETAQETVQVAQPEAEDMPPPLKASEPVRAMETATPVEPTEAEKPATPVEPAEPAASAEPAEPAEPAEAAEPAAPAEPQDIVEDDMADQSPADAADDEPAPAEEKQEEDEGKPLLLDPAPSNTQSGDTTGASLADPGLDLGGSAPAAEAPPPAPKGPRILGNVPPPSGFPAGDYRETAAPPPPPARAGAANEPRAPVNRAGELAERANRAYGTRP